MRIADNNVVLFHYVVKNAAGEIPDHSPEDSSLSYLHGKDNIGWFGAVEGKQAGDKLDVKLDAADGYGKNNEELVQSVPLADFGDQAVEVGKRFHAVSCGYSYRS